MDRAEVHRPGRRWSLAVLAIYLALGLILFSSAWRDPTHISIGIIGDPQLFTWLLAWTPFALTHSLDPLVTHHVVFPEGANLMWNTAQVVPGIVLWPTQAGGPVLTLNVLMTLSLPLSGWCAYLALGRLVPGRLGPTLGGLLYGFSPYMLGHALGQPDFVVCLFPPLAMLLLHELLVLRRRPPWQPGGLLGLAAAAQLLTGEEILATTALAAFVGAVVLAALRPGQVRNATPHVIRGLLAALAIFLLIGAWPLAVQFLGPQRVQGAIRTPDVYVNDLLTFFVPSDVYLLAPAAAVEASRRWTGNAAEWNGYVGVPLALLLAWTAIRHRRTKLVAWAALSGLVIAVLSLGPHLHLDGRARLRAPLPWLAVQHLPVFENILPARLSLYFFLCAAVALAYLASRLEVEPVRWRAALGYSVIALSLLPLLPRLPWPAAERPVPEFFTSSEMSRIPEGSVALVLPFTTEPGGAPPQAPATAVDAMVWQASAGYRFRMPSGYMRIPGLDGRTLSGPAPTTTADLLLRVAYGEPAPALTPDLRQRMAADLAHWRVRTVIVGPMDNQEQEVELLRRLLGREPELDRGVYVWWDVRPDRLPP